MTSIRLNSTIQFDETTERDIIELISSLNSCHKTGQFIGTLIRLAVDNPEVLKRSDETGRYNTSEMYNYLSTNSLSKNRAEFLNGVYKEVLDIKNKVDDIYKMALEMRTMAQFGKQIGIEDRSKNTMRAGFLLEKQLGELEHKLGVKFTGDDSIFMSNKLNTSDKVVSDIVEYIINTYGGIADEIKASLAPVQVQTVQIPVQQVADVNTAAPAVPEKATETTEVQKPSVPSNGGLSVYDEDEVIDFGSEPTDADLDALESFFGTGG